MEQKRIRGWRKEKKYAYMNQTVWLRHLRQEMKETIELHCHFIKTGRLLTEERRMETETGLSEQSREVVETADLAVAMAPAMATVSCEASLSSLSMKLLHRLVSFINGYGAV